MVQWTCFQVEGRSTNLQKQVKAYSLGRKPQDRGT
jgi:hypothetical protein